MSKHKLLAMITAFAIAAMPLTAIAAPGGTPPGGEGGGEQGGGSSSSSVSYSAANTISSDTTASGGTYASTTAEENALLVTGGTSTLTDITVTKSGSPSGSSDNYDFYGTNAAVCVTDGTLIITGSGTTVTSDASYGNAVYAHSDGVINISDATITTTGRNSGGIMVTGGGTLTATDLTVSTSGDSAASIRSDKGGGTITATGGSYSTSGQGSPAIYATAAITVNDASLTSTHSEGVVVEGSNSVTLNGVTLTDTNDSLNGQSTTYKNVFLYQSQSGDAADGTGYFTAEDSTITTNKGDTFFVTNNTAVITLENNEFVNNDSTGYFLRAMTGAWGTSGSNGGDVTLTATDQDIDGDIYIDSISSLAMTMSEGSTFSGAITGNGTSTDVSLTMDSTSTWTLTGDSYVKSLSDSGVTNYSNIDLNGYTLYVNGTAITSTDYSGSSSATEAPTATPTAAPTAAPTATPTAAPTTAPTEIPTEVPVADRVTINSVTVTNGAAAAADFTVGTAGTYTAYVAVYDTDEALAGVRLMSLTETGTISFDELAFSNGQTLKCMVWDENMIPAAELYSETAEVTETEEPAAAEETTTDGFLVTFDADDHASVTVYDTQDITSGGTENATTAYARSSDTGEIDISGSGQVNFVVTVDDGYTASVSIDSAYTGKYKNLKQDPESTGDTSYYRITKITGDLTVTLTSAESTGEEEQTPGGTIHLNGDSIDVSEAVGAAADGSVLTISSAGAYTIDGTLTDGQIVVAASAKTDEVVLNLDNVSVTSSTGNVLDATKGCITLANVSGSTSTFISTYSYTDTDGSTAGGVGIYSKNDLTIKGADSDTKIIAKSTYGNGIRCKADLEIGTGDIEVTAGNHGIKGDESIKFTKKAGSITVTAAGDGIKTDAIDSDTLELDTDSSYQPKGTITVNGGTINITADGDGIQADYGFIAANSPSITIVSGTEGIKANTMTEDAWYYTDDTSTTTATIEGYIQIGGGTINITSIEDAIKAAGYINVTDGDITIVVKDGSKSMDGIQSGVSNDDETVYSSGNINISGGTFNITTNGGASGKTSTEESCKGIKAVNALNISGGDFTIDSYDDAIHSNYTVSITGGTFEIASGDDGVHADYWLTMGTDSGADDDYTMNISTSYEGLEGSVIEYLSGTTTLYATDDGVNAAGDYEENGTYHAASTNDLYIAAGPGGGNQPGNPGGGNGGQNPGSDDTSDYGMLYIKGGLLYLRAQGDGLDTNGSALMSDGVVVVAGTTQGGNGVFDKGDSSGCYFTVTGGTLIGYGTTDMQDNPTVSGQKYLNTKTSLTKGTVKNVQLASGSYIGIVPEYTLSNALLFVTSPDMSSGSVYSGSVSYSDSNKLIGRTVSNVWYGAYQK